MEDASFSKIYQKGNIPVLTAKDCAFDKVDITRNFEAHLTSEKPFAINYSYSLDPADFLADKTVKVCGAGKKMSFEKPEF